MLLSINPPRRRGGGFTLIELIIVVAIIGVIAAILIPNLLDALQKTKQKRTMADMRDLGSAWFSWLTDQVSAAAAGSSAQTYDLSALTVALSADELLSSLYVSSTMFYTRDVPGRDGWARLYDYRWSGNPSSSPVLGIRSLGRDGAEGPNGSGAVYNVGPFLASDYDQDIVWADGFFVTYPTGTSAQ
jgi:general secretion pathway protein G